MTAVMQGVRILEVAEHTFVPAASALLADWGAEVIKIEHVERGDAMRGLASTGVAVDARPTCTCCSSTRTAASRASASTSRPPDGPRHPLQARRHRPTCSSPTSCRASATKLQHRRRRHPGRTTRTSSTCAAPARASAGPTPTRARTTRSRSGPAPGVAHRRQAPRVRPRADPAGARLRRLDRRHDHRRRDHGRAVPPRAHRRGDHRRRVAARHRAVGDGPGDGAVAAARHARGRRRPADADARNPLVAQLRRPRTGAALRSRCLQAGQVLAAAVRGRSAGPSSPPTRASPTTRRSWPTAPRPPRSLARGVRRRDRSTSGASGSPTSSASGPSCRTRSRRRPTRRPSPTATSQDCETADGVPFQLVAAPVQFDEEPAAAAPGARVQRARRRDPRRARPRLGRDRRPQGPRRRRLTTTSIIDIQEELT